MPLLTLERWAIRQISTGYFMPLTLRNHTEAEPKPDDIPRLFDSKASASSALSRWCEGVWRLSYCGGGYPDYEPDIEWGPENPPTTRDRDDMEVVPVRVTVELLP